MQSAKKIWRVRTQHPVLQQIMARELSISQITAQLLINRGIYTVEHARAFFACAIHSLHDPGLLKDLERAAARIEKAVKNGEKILVYGDYDADGVTATALLVLVIRRLGGKAGYRVPDRLAEGYGLSLDALRQAVEKGVTLVVTVDCGTSNMLEARWALENAVDLVVTDHHEPPEELPPAYALVNPKRRDCAYPFKELAGVGVALKLVQALFRRMGGEPGAWLEYLDLVCLGTVADIVPLVGENRTLVKHGLPAVAATKNQGLAALISVSGLKLDHLCSREVGFVLAPRLNAAGRVGSAGRAVELLLAENQAEATAIAGELCRFNQERQDIESSVLNEALQMLAERPRNEDRVLVLASGGWHPGVSGIVAARLMERFYRPVLLIALVNGKGKGSARSVPGLNIYRALDHCHDYLLDFGGHAAAAGFSIEPAQIENFRCALNEYAKIILSEEQLTPSLEVDTLVSLDEISDKLIEEMNLLRPYGHCNPRPMLAARGVPVLQSKVVGKDAAHLKLRLAAHNHSAMDGIGFRLGACAEVVATGEAVDLAFVPGINEFNGRRSLQIEVKELGLPAVLDSHDAGSEEGGFLADLFQRDCKGLAGAQRALYAPEFILRSLAMLKAGDPEAPERLPPDEAEFNVRPGVFASGLAWFDHRDLADRPVFLRAAAACPEASLTLVSCGFQAAELAHYLNLTCPAARGKILFCHSAMSPAERQKVWERFFSGAASFVVTTVVPPALKNGYVQSFIFYHLPFSPAGLAEIADLLAAPAAKVHLLARAADLAVNRRHLEALAPGRDFLAAFYLYLRREAGAAAPALIDYPAAALAMRGAGFAPVREYTIEVAVTIFRQLGLIEAEEGTGCCRLSLPQGPARKQELAGAAAFRLCHRLKNASNAWMEQFWNGTCGKGLSQLI